MTARVSSTFAAAPRAEAADSGLAISGSSASSTVQREVDRPEILSRPFEESLGKNIFTFWKGRIALFAILKALGIGAGDQVVIPGFTCFILPSAISFTGAEPLYADIDPCTFNLSVE